jgi:hypothetical protein
VRATVRDRQPTRKDPNGPSPGQRRTRTGTARLGLLDTPSRFVATTRTATFFTDLVTGSRPDQEFTRVTDTVPHDPRAVRRS